MSFLQQLADEAPEAGFVNFNYGKLTINPKVVKWTDDGGKRVPVKTDLKAGTALGPQESLELEIFIDIQEFNPELQFTYKKFVPVKKSGTVLTDWGETVEPSLIAIFGKAWTEKAMKNPYVEVEDAPVVSGKASDKGKVYSVPKFTRVFATKEECAAAREERYGKKDSSSSSADAPEVEPPVETVKQINALIASVGEDATMTMLESKSFGNYDPNKLMELAKNFKG